MLNYYVLLGFSCSIAIAAFIGLVRYRSIAADYRPFLFLVWLALINEVLSIVLIELYGTNVYNGNVYVLAEMFLVIWQFYNWGRVQRTASFYRIIAMILTLVWVADNLVLHRFSEFNSLFRVSSSVVLAFLAIDHINFTTVSANRRIATDPSFLVSVAMLLFFSLKGVMEVFYLFRINLSNNFYNAIILLLSFTNLLTNLLYAIAVLWMPQKQRFSLPY